MEHFKNDNVKKGIKREARRERVFSAVKNSLGVRIRFFATIIAETNITMRLVAPLTQERRKAIRSQPLGRKKQLKQNTRQKIKPLIRQLQKIFLLLQMLKMSKRQKP